jgi:hypothetical protein
VMRLALANSSKCHRAVRRNGRRSVISPR